jgi:preprotein translocase subunit SecD
MFAPANSADDPITVLGTALAAAGLIVRRFTPEIGRRWQNLNTLLLLAVSSVSAIACDPVGKKPVSAGTGFAAATCITLQFQSRENENGEKLPITVEQIEQAIPVIENRLNSLGIPESVISRSGDDKIEVRISESHPDQLDKIRKTLELTNQLKLHQVSPRSEEVGPDGNTLAQRVQAGQEIVPGFRVYKMREKDADGNETTRPILLNRRAALDGDDIDQAHPSPTQPDAVAVTLNKNGARKMATLTARMRLGVDRLAVVLDGEAINAATVHDQLGKHFIITGLNRPNEVENLCNALTNPFENALSVVEVRTVAPLRDAKTGK